MDGMISGMERHGHVRHSGVTRESSGPGRAHGSLMNRTQPRIHQVNPQKTGNCVENNGRHDDSKRRNG